MIPLVAKIKIGQELRRPIGIWFPIFLVYPLLLALVLLFVPLFLVYLLVVFGPSGLGRSSKIFYHSWKLFAGLRGLELEIKNNNREISIALQ